MSGFTKQAIQASFLKLLDTYPLRDIPALLEQILADQAAALVASYQSVRSLEECLSAVLEKLIANKRRVQNIYCSVNRDVFESALMQVCGYLTGLYVDSAAQGFALSAQYREPVSYTHSTLPTNREGYISAVVVASHKNGSYTLKITDLI